MEGAAYFSIFLSKFSNLHTASRVIWESTKAGKNKVPRGTHMFKYSKYAGQVSTTQRASLFFLSRYVHMDKNLVVQLGTTWLCDIECAVVMQKVVVRPTSAHPRFFFINLARLQLVSSFK